MSNQYAFLTQWRVEGTCGEGAGVLSDPVELPRWWPSVYLAVEELRPPDASGLGRRLRLHTKGWLPHTLTWAFGVVEAGGPYGSAAGPGISRSSRRGIRPARRWSRAAASTVAVSARTCRTHPPSTPPTTGG